MRIASIIAFLLLSLGAFGQVKTDTIKAKKTAPKYQYFVKVSPAYYEFFVTSAKNYEDNIKYDPSLTADEKIKLQIFVEKNLKIIRKTVAIDSTQVKADTVKKPIPIKRKT